MSRTLPDFHKIAEVLLSDEITIGQLAWELNDIYNKGFTANKFTNARSEFIDDLPTWGDYSGEVYLREGGEK